MVSNPAIYTDIQGLAGLRAQSHRDPQQHLREVASQFEAIFIQNMLKNARVANFATGALDGPHSDTYREMYEQQLALLLAKGKGIGVAEMLVRQLQDALPNTQQPNPISPKQNTQNTLWMKSGVTNSLSSPPPLSNSVPKSSPSLSNSAPESSPPLSNSLTEITAPPSLSPAAASQNLTPEEFVASVWSAAQIAAKELGVDPKVLIAQAALESGWGRSVPQLPDGRSSHNLFGIKADRRWNGASTVVSTLEYEDGIAVRRRDPFRSYESFTESLSDYARFLRSNPRYQEALKQVDDPEAFLRGLQAAGYATDPAYARKVASVLRGDTLRTALANLKGV